MQAMLVMGPESSGTRLVTRILVEAGCDGDWTHAQRFDTPPLPEPVRPIVWRRSVPHARHWPRFYVWAAAVRHAGYEPMAVVVIRETTALVRSQMSYGHVSDVSQALNHIQRAQIMIHASLVNERIPFYTLPLEGLILHPAETIAGLLLWAGLDADSQAIAERVQVKDTNAKHYADIVGKQRAFH